MNNDYDTIPPSPDYDGVVDCSCGGKNCPTATFHEDGSVTVYDDGESVLFPKEAAEKFARALRDRGYVE